MFSFYVSSNLLRIKRVNGRVKDGFIIIKRGITWELVACWLGIEIRVLGSG